MARFEFKLPDIGEGVAEAEIVEWHVDVGDDVTEGQILAAVMTDKATVEMEAPVSGKLVERNGAVGDILAVGSTLVAIETSDTDTAQAQAHPVRASCPPAATPEPAALASNPENAQAEPSPSSHAEQRALASPAVRRRAKALGIDLGQVPASDGVVHHSDLDGFVTRRQHSMPSAGQPERPAQEIPVVGMRRQIAKRMQEAKRHIPHFTYVEEVDVTELERLRHTLNRRAGQGRPQLNLLPFLVAGLCRALADFPALNAHYDDERNVVTQFGAVHVGIAAQTDPGLMVPVLRDAHRMDLWRIADGIAGLASDARAGKLAASELRGGTISISSLGKLGGIASTPIVNRPEVAIIAPNRVIERPVWMNGSAIPRKIMNLSISCDHRVIDGQVAAAFVQDIKDMLETPALLFLP